MKKNIFVSLFVLLLTLAMIAGGTMAWFTAEDEAGEAIFTAGTVDVQASNWGIGSQYYDPDSATYVYGVEYQTGNLYEIDVENKHFNIIYETDKDELEGGDQYSPNGLAFDNDNRRLYFSIYEGSNSELWFYDFKQQKLLEAGTEDGVKIYGATFGNGYYWYIDNGTDKLYKVGFDSDGKKSSSELVAAITGDYEKSFNFGDVVIDIKDNIIYGSTSRSGDDKEFFKYNLDTGIYTEVSTTDGINLQLAFGSDGEIYGHNTWDKDWFQVDKDTGETTKITGLSGKSFNDLASGYVSVWNPGDSSNLRYSITNTGSKDTNIRAKLEGVWDEAGLDPDVVSVELCQGSDWVLNGDYFYYNANDGVVPAGETIELCIAVSLSGGSTGNDYQGKSFTITGMVEAIQASNNASSSKWQITLPIQ